MTHETKPVLSTLVVCPEELMESGLEARHLRILGSAASAHLNLEANRVELGTAIVVPVDPAKVSVYDNEIASRINGSLAFHRRSHLNRAASEALIELGCSSTVDLQKRQVIFATTPEGPRLASHWDTKMKLEEWVITPNALGFNAAANTPTYKRLYLVAAEALLRAEGIFTDEQRLGTRRMSLADRIIKAEGNTVTDQAVAKIEIRGGYGPTTISGITTLPANGSHHIRIAPKITNEIPMSKELERAVREVRHTELQRTSDINEERYRNGDHDDIDWIVSEIAAVPDYREALALAASGADPLDNQEWRSKLS